MMKSRWKKINEVGLPSPGVYWFKDEKTDEVERSIVRMHKNGSKTFEVSNTLNPTHWMPNEDGKDAPV